MFMTVDICNPYNIQVYKSLYPIIYIIYIYCIELFYNALFNVFNKKHLLSLNNFVH